jgi:hypothetical protein
MDNVDPRRTAERKLAVEPSEQRSSSETLDPNRIVPYTETAEESRVKERTLIADPM